jgi:hypothetical protein
VKVSLAHAPCQLHLGGNLNDMSPLQVVMTNLSSLCIYKNNSLTNLDSGLPGPPSATSPLTQLQILHAPAFSMPVLTQHCVGDAVGILQKMPHLRDVNLSDCGLRPTFHKWYATTQDFLWHSSIYRLQVDLPVTPGHDYSIVASPLQWRMTLSTSTAVVGVVRRILLDRLPPFK